MEEAGGYTDCPNLSSATEFHKVPRNMGLRAATLAVRSSLEPFPPAVHPPSIPSSGICLEVWLYRLWPSRSFPHKRGSITPPQHV
jgi:hypothetical protein